jgi:CRISPR-associated endonuclease/helicase Cas3
MVNNDRLILPWKQLWAKTSREKEDISPADWRYHPLICHMLDVAAVAAVMWDHCIAQSLQEILKDSLGTYARALIVFLSGAHDLGKGSPAFQKKEPRLLPQLEKMGFRFSNNEQNRPHGFISAHVLNEFLELSTASAVIARIAGGHHGVFPRAVDLNLGRDTLGNGNRNWDKARRALLEELACVVGLDCGQATQSMNGIIRPGVVPILAGLISVADWIGSNQDFFPCLAEYDALVDIKTTDYWLIAQNRARSALEELGWLPAVRFAVEAGFETVFKGLSPNALQMRTIELVSKRISPYLMIIEAPMGEGKTEAALYAADVAMSRGFARGMYIAMPTQATSNAMFSRVLNDYLRRRGHEGRLNLQLVHGDALLASRTAAPKEGEIKEFKPDDGEDGDMEAQSWFTAKKRPLLAPFGVGTIDQSLLSVLQTKHWFVRLFGLAGKVVIFDEVHAYDAYMSTILERLLHWLAEVDCTVILLSATLPETKRSALISAYSGRDDLEYGRYPRITLAFPYHYPRAEAIGPDVCIDVPMGVPRTIGVRFANTDLATLAGIIKQKLEHGGCCAVVCNTVDRSIEVYRFLSDDLNDTMCVLFHARTLQMWRRMREEEVICKFGKGEESSDGTYMNSNRPKRAVLIATQVIEQSLDLDFDIMISEIAPVDLLLQRFGRLHRHPRRRPKGLESPQFIIACDAGPNGPPPESFGVSNEHVYDRYILLRTWLALRQREKIEVPGEIEALIETVYGVPPSIESADWEEALRQARQKAEFDQAESEKAARRLMVSEPKDPSDLVEEFNDQLVDDEDPQVHESIRAATRESDPFITVVMQPASKDYTTVSDVSEVRKLLDWSVKLSHRGIYHALVDKGESPTEWSKNVHLRHARLLWLDEQGQGTVGDYVLKVDEKLGVIIEKGDKKNGGIQPD